MLSITDKSYKPTLQELCNYTSNVLFDKLCLTLREQYAARSEVMYSGDKVLLGWNVRFAKSGRTLCRLYPRQGSFGVLLVVGRKEKEKAEELLPTLTEQTRSIYNSTPEGMGQRWLLLSIDKDEAPYKDLLTLIDVRLNAK